MFKDSEIKFITAIGEEKNIPELILPSIAFIGRSNVGKSSLINAICNRKKLARTSRTPGHTKQINVFQASEQLLLIDLPGYGYTNLPKIHQNRLQQLIFNFFSSKQNLKLVNVLVDIRRGLKSSDLIMLELLINYKRKWQIVFTKSDKVPITQQKETITKAHESIMKICDDLKFSIIITSSRKKIGIENLYTSFIEAIAN